MTNKTEPCLYMHMSRLLSVQLNCPVDMVANKLSATIDVSPSNTAKVMRAMDNLIGNNAVVLCTKIDHSKGVSPLFGMPQPNAGREVHTLAHMVNNYLNDGRDIYGDLAHAASLSREDAIRVFNVMSNWLYGLKITPMNTGDATASNEAVSLAFSVSNDFEHMIADTMRDVLARVRVYSQQGHTTNAPLMPENYDVDVIISRLVKNIDAIVWGDGVNPMRDVTSLTDVITYLLMFLTLYTKASDDAKFNEWSIHKAMEILVNTLRCKLAMNINDKLQQERDELIAENKRLESLVQELRGKSDKQSDCISGGKLKATVDAVIGNQFSVKVNEHGQASGIGLGDLQASQLPSFIPPQPKTSHDVITSNKEVYAFYGNVTININEGK